MPACKVCGSWFVKIKPHEELCDKCERALCRLSGYVAPVRHGRWERTADGAALCTACKRKMNPSQYGYAFCSLCGAKMDGGAD